MTNTNTATFRRIEDYAGSSDGELGPVHTTTTEVIIAREGGLLIVATTTGTVEGERVNTRRSKFWPGATFDAAVAYRTPALGYARIA